MIRRVIRLLLAASAAALLPSAAAAQSQYVRTVEDRDHVTVMEFGGIYDRQPDPSRDYEQQVRQATTTTSSLFD
jgi:hypothetical protein